MIQQTAQRGSLSFENTEIAFRGKSNRELTKAYRLFKVIGSNFLTKIGLSFTNFALKTGLPVTGLIRKTIFSHFCGGETIHDCLPSIERLAGQGVETILDYAVESEDNERAFDAICAELLRIITYAQHNPNISFSVFKPTGLGRFSLFEKVNAKLPLTKEEVKEYNRVKKRIQRICKACHDRNIRLLIDAEHSWIQDAIDDIAREMMRTYNRNAPVVYNTYQLYRTDRLATLQVDYYLAETEGFFLGAKLVRGAYMEIERKRADELGYSSPIQPDKQSTDRDYNRAVQFCLDRLDHIGFLAGTHNEESCKILAEEIERRQLPHNHPNIHFAQLLGMSDHLSFNLAEAGYHVAKYLPYGPVKAVMPYLFRRAQENTSLAGQTGRELSLITQEKKRRKSIR